MPVSPGRRGTHAKDFGCDAIGQERPCQARLVACYGREAKEPWLLVTTLEDALPIHIVRPYQRRMRIEQMFRDWKTANGAWTPCASPNPNGTAACSSSWP